MLLRGFGKFLAVVVAAGLAGALIGIALSKLSGDDAADEPVIAATTASPKTTASTPAATGTSTATTAAVTPGVYRVPLVKVQSALLGPVSDSNGRALVAVRVGVTNRGNRPLTIDDPTLLSGQDVVTLAASRRPAAGALLKPIAPGATGSGVLRFTIPSAIAQRLTANPAARLKVAKRTVVLKLTTNQPATP